MERRNTSGDDLGIEMDLVRIRRDLREPEADSGAYCQDYESFKRIYRFMERGLRRSGMLASVILMTLADQRGSFIPFDRREELLEHLKNILQYSLRSGDVYTQYSSCQFLIMTPGTTKENADDIGRRIQEAFLSGVADSPDVCLQHVVYPLQPAALDGDGL